MLRRRLASNQPSPFRTPLKVTDKFSCRTLPSSSSVSILAPKKASLPSNSKHSHNNLEPTISLWWWTGRRGETRTRTSWSQQRRTKSSGPSRTLCIRWARVATWVVCSCKQKWCSTTSSSNSRSSCITCATWETRHKFRLLLTPTKWARISRSPNNCATGVSCQEATATWVFSRALKVWAGSQCRRWVSWTTSCWSHSRPSVRTL